MKVGSLFRKLWSWKTRPLGASLQQELDELRADNNALTSNLKKARKSLRTQRGEIQSLHAKALPGTDFGDGHVFILVAVVTVWLLLAGGAALTLLIVVFLGRPPPDMSVVKDGIGLVGLAASPIVVAAIQKWRGSKKNNDGE